MTNLKNLGLTLADILWIYENLIFECTCCVSKLASANFFSVSFLDVSKSFSRACSFYNKRTTNSVKSRLNETMKESSLNSKATAKNCRFWLSKHKKHRLNVISNNSAFGLSNFSYLTAHALKATHVANFFDASSLAKKLNFTIYLVTLFHIFSKALLSFKFFLFIPDNGNVDTGITILIS